MTDTPAAAEEDERETIRAWLQEAMRATGLKATPLARAAGIAPSTILRALEPGATVVLDRRTIRKIMDVAGLPPPGASPQMIPANLGRAPPDGLAEPELVPYQGQSSDDLTANQYLRLVNTRALDLAGYLPGDLLTLDMSVMPAADDIVDAQVYAVGRAGAETVLRLYDPPYIVSRSSSPDIRAKPLLVDGERVRIAAVVIRAQRWPRKITG